MGAHSDMWNPRALRWSSMVEKLGWKRKLAPLRPAFDRLGTDPAGAGEAARACRRRLAIQCGIHNSSASLLPHLKERTPPFAVVSTGTWVILFAVGGDIDKLDPSRDTLANVSAFGDPVPCGALHGRARVRAADRRRRDEAERVRSSTRVLAERIMALPTFVAGLRAVPARQGPLDARSGDAVTRRAQRRGEPLPRADDGGIADARGRVPDRRSSRGRSRATRSSAARSLRSPAGRSSHRTLARAQCSAR